MYMKESSFVLEGQTYFSRSWACCHRTWEHVFKWDDLDSASYWPICGRCLNGSLFIP